MVNFDVMPKYSLYLMSALYVVTGLLHFIQVDFFLKIMPPWISWHKEIVYLTGAWEIVCAVLLLFLPMRNIAAWGLIILLVAVFPANIQMMLNYLHEHNPNLWITIVRLPLQPLLIWWVNSFIPDKVSKVSSQSQT